jgi:flagellar protein FlaG
MRTEAAVSPEFVRMAERPERGAPARAATATEAATRAPAAAQAASTGQAARRAELESARREANELLARNGSELAFELDDSTRRVVVKLIDTRTREVLRQMPSPEMLAIAKALREGDGAGSLVRADA